MAKQGELILTSDNFFDSIEFQKRSELEQVSYILFYVTEVAHLRKDMIPEIIADRIQDQYESFFQRNPGADKDNYAPIKAEQVKRILEKNPEWFQKVNSGVFSGSDRDPKMKKTPFVLTQNKKDELWLKFDKDIKSKINLQKKRLFMDKTQSTALWFLILLLCTTYVTSTFLVNDDELVVTSVQDYAKKIKLNEYTPTKKSVLFVYYVTKLTKMRKEVFATAIHDRVVELGCEMPSQEELNTLLDHSEMLTAKDGSTKSYSLSNLGVEYAENVVNSHIKKQTGIDIPLELMIFILGALGSLLVIVFKVAYSFGKQL